MADGNNTESKPTLKDQKERRSLIAFLGAMRWKKAKTVSRLIFFKSLSVDAWPIREANWEGIKGVLIVSRQVRATGTYHLCGYSLPSLETIGCRYSP